MVWLSMVRQNEVTARVATQDSHLTLSTEKDFEDSSFMANETNIEHIIASTKEGFWVHPKVDSTILVRRLFRS
jgi:predicted ABC-type ATPase